jgi:hypothetical protein
VQVTIPLLMGQVGSVTGGTVTSIEVPEQKGTAGGQRAGAVVVLTDEPEQPRVKISAQTTGWLTGSGAGGEAGTGLGAAVVVVVDEEPEPQPKKVSAQ